ncbi:FecR family protein [Chitinophaga jiangningensis]|uniref:FecR family protein n=1 Tax=Chitinophaga jiangningensis TaxID=1419482 RepID=A0A1M7CXG8_9BACT|nr:FecR family protein [Chitinophaga jiangningensis]SHL71951.1 FecR family protein [Chitinophaga jiangningensis]
MLFKSDTNYFKFLLPVALCTAVACHTTPPAAEKKPSSILTMQAPGVHYTSYQGDIGARRRITLPDSSVVILNSSSLLLVPDNYGQEKRQVLLDGDAWFTVNPAPAVFTVIADKLTAEVLGTQFRMRCFTNQQGATVHLLTGKLKVSKSYHSETDNQPEILERGNMILANKEIDLMEKETYNPQDAESWLADSLQLTNAQGLLMWRTLEDWYGVEISVKGDASKTTPVTKLFVKATLQQVLDALGKEQGFSYKTEGSKVEIKF